MMPADYTLLDATLEILLMLLAAFLLGWLFCWLMKKLFGNKQKDAIQQSHEVSSPDLNLQANRPSQRTGLSASSRERLYDPDVGIPRSDIDNSVDVNIPTINEPAVQPVEIDTPDIPTPDVEVKTPRPRIDIPDLKTPDIDLPNLDIKGKVDAGLDASKGAIGKGLGVAAAGIGAIAVGANSLKDKAVDVIDDIDLNLKKPDDVEIELPDADTSELTAEVDLSDTPDLTAGAKLSDDLPDLDTNIELPDADVPNLDANIELPGADVPDLDADIELPDADVPDLDADVDMPDLSANLELPDVGLPEVTPEIDTEIDLDIDTPPVDIDLPDAELPSADIDLADLDLPEAPVDINTPDISGALDTAAEPEEGLLGKGLGAAAAGIGVVTAGAASLKDKATDKVGELSDSLTSPDLPANKVKSSSDDLTRINGIDSSIATLLSNQGINTYKQLRDTNRSTLKAYLDEAGNDSLREIEPASWPHQAKLCAEKNWVKLSEYQSFLSGRSIDLTDSGSGESFGDTIKDDLKKIEGIGPFFESLLNKAGITTYEQLKDTDRDTLKKIIDAAGPDYRMHEPETWPYQAGLAHQGDWKKLQDYIHFMTGRN